MITKLTLQNFKSIGKQEYDFTQFDLLVGRNNSGKSTILQAMAIWQFCVDEFRTANRTGNRGIQIVLPNFTALPVPEFNLLWKDKTDRHWPEIDGKKKQEYILISILVEWQRANGEIGSFGVNLRYQSSQSIYAIPSQSWEYFDECKKAGDLPRIAYVPPFSGLEPLEKGSDEAALRQKVGTGQPGSVLRNLLLRVSKQRSQDEWKELEKAVQKWFSVELQQPEYDPAKNVHINVEYRHNKRNYDIIAGGSGFHQTLTLLAFLYGYNPTTILLDEPDAHLHVNLQREIIDFFKEKSQQRNIQFLIATHAEEFLKGVDAGQIIPLLNQTPQRFNSIPTVIRAMAEVTNEEITRAKLSPHIVYVEGESDERILRAWAGECKIQDSIDKICFKLMRGGDKKKMRDAAENHFQALKTIVPEVRKLMIFDLDDKKEAFHPDADNSTLFEWKRKNIENYLLVPDAWRRVAMQRIRATENDLFSRPVIQIIDGFFSGQNLTLPPQKIWKNIDANIFQMVDGKKILFDNDNSLFHQLRNYKPTIIIPKDDVAGAMNESEIREDVYALMEKIQAFVARN